MPDLGLSGGVGPQGAPVVGDSPPAGPAPGGNGPAPAPYNTPIPGAAQYGQLIALAQKAYQQTMANLGLQRGQLLQQYGYTGTIDPATGLVKNLGVDAHNPYGLYQQTLHAGGQQMGSARDEFAARNLGNSGLEHQAETGLKYDFGKTTSALTQSLQQSLLGIQQSQTNAYFTEQQSIVGAQLQALQQAIAMMMSGSNLDPANLAGIQLPQPD